ncbi:hypothetical protein IE077_004123 [Cardiosporidium cionae]|uniref:Bidirectional sugar transporter SWEET n=1 Tax=Cardiosporidium cionae TaxID=476202 RepID=A0ABQ7J7K4_9APIC|nr:hypothetical protein IE077_004123 [Cardiosporidium cionae]|eukprot:KAF8819685.1 hypothetical protein IE077_004123 [Cardiosporidium cionae]
MNDKSISSKKLAANEELMISQMKSHLSLHREMGRFSHSIPREKCVSVYFFTWTDFPFSCLLFILICGCFILKFCSDILLRNIDLVFPLFAVISPIFSFLAFLSPVRTIIKALSSRDPNILPVKWFISQSIACIISIYYGFRITSMPFLIANCIGIIIQSAGLACYYTISCHSLKWIRFLSLYFIPTFITIIGGYHLSDSVVGALCGVTQVIVPVFVLLECIYRRWMYAYSDKVRENVPLSLLIMYLLSNLIWAFYGLLLDDAAIHLPAFIGLVILFLNIVLQYWTPPRFIRESLIDETL